jgi:hypothetical protein
MPSTYTLIKGETLASSAASYTFTAIPSTFTDFVIKGSVRSDIADTDRELQIWINGSTALNYSYTRLTGTGAAASSSSASSNDYINGYKGVSGATSTSNTFADFEIYVPNYAGSTNKPLSIFGANENNTSTAYIYTLAGLRSVTDAITSISIRPQTSNFVSGSSFYLYCIKNS